MLPESKKEKARWRSECPEDESGTCGVSYHLTKADAEMRNSVHKHDLEIENIEGS